MKLGLVMVVLAGCGIDTCIGTPVRSTCADCNGLPDAPRDPNDAFSCSGDSCSLLTQAGCITGDKCTRALYAPFEGCIACVPDGAHALGEACTIAPVSAGGADDCVGGTICAGGVCKQLCDNNGGTPGCPAQQACVAEQGVVIDQGATTIPAGVCETTCDPLDDNDFDGSGTRFTKSGTSCGSDATVGCYGIPSPYALTYFTCASPAPGTELLTHRTTIPGFDREVNDCMSGYTIAFSSDGAGSMNVDCYAFCRPGDAYLGNPNPQLPNGVSPHACNTTDALGNFGAVPDGGATSNGEHCAYSWLFEQDSSTGVVHHSPTSDTVGICFDHSKHKYDPTGGANDTTIVPPCAALPLAKAIQFGCVSTATAGLFVMSQRPAANLPEPQHPSIRDR